MDPRSFKDLRDSLYKGLVACSCVPQVENDGVKAEHPERRFFPAGTATKVLATSTLEQIFTLVIATGPSQWSALHSAHLARQLESRELQVYLAILITCKCDIESLICFTRKLVVPSSWTDEERELAKLPVDTKDDLRAVVDDDVTADIFLQKQHDFLAPTIEKNKEVRGQFRRLPYAREKLIGEGSFGKIYEVAIPPHHFKNQHSMSNDDEVVLARKDFVLNAADKAHEKERDVLREIVRNAKSHQNIMKSLGSLENGLTYSIFMPLANCDLKQYMELHPSPPTTFWRKAQIVQSAVGLAGAIVYLHEELETPVYEKLSCFHMDLKPANILVVVDPETNQELWKLSDFNMSRVKMKRKPADEQLTPRKSFTFHDNIYEINQLFKRRVSDPTDASMTEGTLNRRGWGTYLAPETCIESHTLQAESDTWSLGCVLSVVFTYLYRGQAAVTEYAELRVKKGADTFFAFPDKKGSNKPIDAYVDDAVKRWHKHIRLETKRINSEEGVIFEDMIRFLGDYVLVVNPKQRRETSARDVRERLIAAFKAFRSLAMVAPVSPKSPKRFRVSGFTRLPWKKTSEGDAKTSHWRIPLSAVKTCVFGPNAQPLVCVTDSNLTVHSLEHVLLSTDHSNNDDFFSENLMTYGNASPEDKGRSWIPVVGVSDQYVLAATNHDKFDCYFFHIALPGNHNTTLELAFHWQLPLPKVAKLALSPDAKYAAFVLFGVTSDLQNCSIYITRLDWLQAAQSEEFHSIVSSSSDSNSTLHPPLGRPIALPCSAEDVCDLRFSNSNALYVITKPKQNLTENVMYVYAWAWQDDRHTALAPSQIKHDGKHDILRSIFTWFAPYNQSSAFAILSQEKMVIIRDWELKRYSQSNAQGHRLLQILLSPEDQTILALGTREGSNELQLLTFPVANARDDLKIQPEKKLPGMSPQSRFVTAVNATWIDTLPQRRLLIAVMEGLAVRIVRVNLGLP